MDAKSFFNLVVQVREAQKEYFRTRLTSSLQRSKELERQLDVKIKRVQEIIKPKDRQQKLWEP